MSDRDTTRRRYLKTVGATGAVGISGLAGCIGGGGGGPIPVGTILPITGALQPYGSGMQESANLAVSDVNDAGGPLGRELDVFNTDSGTSSDQAIQRYETLVSENSIVGFVGAASSGVSVPLSQRVASDQVMQISNASTSPVLATLGYGDDDEPPKYFGRTAPNDGQQGIVMGMIMNESQYIGADTAAFLYVDNAYGEGLANKAEAQFEGETLQKVGYSGDTTDYSSTLDALHEGDPDTIGFVGYPGNGTTILSQWSQGGYNTTAQDWVLSEGLNSNTFLSDNSDIVQGMYISSPNPEGTEGSSVFEEKIGDANTLFAAHAYDAMFMIALAIEMGGAADGTTIAENLRSISRPPGNNVTVGEFQAAKDSIADGNDINYQGASSPVNLNQQLEPLNRFAILEVQEGGRKSTLETIPRSFFEGKL